MQCRWIYLLLLLSTTIWSSGLARAIHESLEHAPPAKQMVVATPTHLTHKAAHEVDRHDGCITCKLFALACAIGVFVLAILLAGMIRRERRREPITRTRPKPYFPALPSCGPPAFC